ncbi:MAG TPA: GNAT family N-acetyltransferase [Thermoplasmata archaeon]|nr:GNAT family N-acetyltransferase [Thermoplasmata archaeon]
MRGSRNAHPVDYSGTVIRRVDWSKELPVVRRLFRDYRDWLAEHAGASTGSTSAVPVGLAGLDQDIAGLPGVFGPPAGDVVLAFKGSDLVACGAVRELEPHVGEIKRIYVRADHRGPVFGPRFADACRQRARELGHDRVRVDALPTMASAIQFYQEIGFKPIPAYWAHPVPGALFFEWTAGDRAAPDRASRRARPRRAGR